MLKNGIGVSINHSAAIALLCGASVMIGGCSGASGESYSVCGAGMSLDPITNRCESVCGDGLKNTDEECDDGDRENGDGCSVNCKLEGRVCDTNVQPTFCPEQCEPQTDCGGGKCVNTSWGPTCVCNDYIGAQCKTKKCEMTAGMNFTVAIDSQGTVTAWGDNSFGQLADAKVAESRPSPAPIAALPNLGDIHELNASPVGGHALALDSKGTIWSWGDDTDGRLGSFKSYKNEVVHYTSTGAIKGPVTEIAAGARHSLAISDAKIYSWGAMKTGAVGPVFTQIAACDGFNLAVDDEGFLHSWGDKNDAGQLGNGGISPQPEPKVVKFPNPTTIVAIACGQSHSLALNGEGDVWAWGSNAYKQLGGSAAGDTPTPIKISFDDGISEPGDARIVAIAAGAKHNVALDAAGHVWTWGDNSLGQRGDGSANGPSPAAPQRVQSSSSEDLLANIHTIDAGGSFTLALDEEGVLWVWGDNTKGQLGYGDYSEVLAPKSSQFECGQESPQ